MRTAISAFGFWLALVLPLALPSPPAHASATFTGIGSSAEPEAVSADGSVVVGVTGAGEAFRWTASGGMVGLGFLPPGGVVSHAYATSADGAVVVGIGATMASGDSRAFRWTAAGGMIALSGLPGEALALGVSADGSVVVGRTAELLGPTPGEAFRWTEATGMVGLGMLPGATESEATAVSDDGAVVVGHSAFTTTSEVFRWTAATGMVDLELPGSDNFAYDVSPDGSVVVGSSSDQAYRWSESTGLVSLGGLPGTSFSEAFGVSADGSVIVGRAGSLPFDTAIVWDAAHGMRALKDVLVDDYGLDLEGWTLTNATGISADGQTIVGWGFNPGGYHEGWIAVIPEPATGVLVALGLVGLVLRVRGDA